MSNLNAYQRTMQNTVNPPTKSVAIKTVLPTEIRKGPELMRAMEWHGTKDVRVVDKERPHVSDPNDVIVRVTTSTICGSDLHLYFNQVPAARPMEKGDTMGHEGVGIVEEVGSGVTKFRRGDRVVISAVISCGQCFYCQKQMFSCCDYTNPSGQMERLWGHRIAALFGYSHLTGQYDGTQAEYCRVPLADVNLLKLPPNISDEVGMLLSDVACTGWHANELGQVKQGDTVAIWGCGPIGLMAAKWAKFRGAKTVISIDNVPHRLQDAKAISQADHVINFDEADVNETLKELVPGGLDVCIDAAGFRFPKTFRHKVETFFKLETDALDIVTEMITAARKGGYVVLIGDYFGYGNHFPIGAFMEKALHMTGGQLYTQKYWQTLLDYVSSGQVDLSPFVTHTMPLDRIDEAYRVFSSQTPGVIKIAIKSQAAASQLP